MPWGWARSKSFGFARYARAGVVVAEGHRIIYIKAGWGHPNHHRDQKFWYVDDVVRGHKTIGRQEGYLTLRDAVAAAQVYIGANACGGLLYYGGGDFQAVCIQRRFIEHDHSSHDAREAVRLGLAQEAT